jgi:hypothetical protein
MSQDRFYELVADPKATSRWFLKSPLASDGSEIDPRTFTKGEPVDALDGLSLPIRRGGTVVDVNFCDFDMIVAPSTLGDALESEIGVQMQRIPISVAGHDHVYEIWNLCSLVDCIDESRSIFTKWTDADGRPDKIGDYRMFVSLRINGASASGRDIFRLSRWPITVVVSEKVKDILERASATGISFVRID